MRAGTAGACSDLRGFRGSAPVRIGNGAKEQLQLDNAGYLLDAAFVYERFGNALSLRFWRHLVKLMDLKDIKVALKRRIAVNLRTASSTA